MPMIPMMHKPEGKLFRLKAPPPDIDPGRERSSFHQGPAKQVGQGISFSKSATRERYLPLANSGVGIFFEEPAI